MFLSIFAQECIAQHDLVIDEEDPCKGALSMTRGPAPATSRICTFFVLVQKGTARSSSGTPEWKAVKFRGPAIISSHRRLERLKGIGK